MKGEVGAVEAAASRAAASRAAASRQDEPARGRATAGTVQSLWRYPVKSMLGESVPAAEVGERGLAGDRAFALLDRDGGTVASAKNPRKWGRLLSWRAALLDRPDRPAFGVRIDFPDGTYVSSDQRDVDRSLSTALGRDVTLCAQAPPSPVMEGHPHDVCGTVDLSTLKTSPVARGAPAGTFFNYAVVHLLTTATLERLGELYPAGRFDVARFRPNVVVQPPAGEGGFVENAWVGRTLCIGDVRLLVVDPCPRCVVTTVAQEGLAADPEILRVAARHSRAKSVTLAPGRELSAVAGVYASVVQPGTLRCGDPVWLE